MKVKQAEEPAFRPITITLEEERELTNLESAINTVLSKVILSPTERGILVVLRDALNACECL